ncbi:hypothetical protein O6H91_07G036800 [Diphasiastrum complanatum]|uniref:Uncharacterized protein n=1 Tax=Diphasiastrum complanatum TaxID=34168 RepID=A0ACC2D432_DIPCM|nr:hypothetical protein O6H91_07G036800 [Diphasiastrum complanatum]
MPRKQPSATSLPREKREEKSVKKEPDVDQKEEAHILKHPSKKPRKTEPYEEKIHDKEPNIVKEEHSQGKDLKVEKDEQKKTQEDQDNQVRVNRAPVLTLWVAVVAQKEGYQFEEGLTYGKHIAGVYAHSKGQRLGLIEAKGARTRKKRPAERFEVFGTRVPVRMTSAGLRLALQNDKPIPSRTVKSYLLRKFGTDYDRVKEAMATLACKYSPDEIGKVGYILYEKFRPQVHPGSRGWGAKGVLDLNYISALAREAEFKKE